MSISRSIAMQFPDLKDKLRSAAIYKKPSEFVGESLKNALFMSLMMSVMVALFIAKKDIPLIIIPIVFVFAFFGMFLMFLRSIDATISKRRREIDRDVLFAGRYLLVKLNSGRPLITAITEASQSYGVAGEYFKEIIKDIEMGTPMEEALERAYKTSPSLRFKKILFQINNSLKIGVDVTGPLEAILQEISHEQLIEIQRYGKKLNSIIMFYLLAAIVVPSLGITLFSLVASMMNISIGMTTFIVILIFLAFVQMIFIGIIKGSRPNLNI